MLKLTLFFTLFLQAGKYEESIRHLEFLQELNKDDFKISMNKAIVEFYKSGQTTIGNLKQSLMAIKSQVIGVTWPTFSPSSAYIISLIFDFFFFLPQNLSLSLGVYVSRRH